MRLHLFLSGSCWISTVVGAIESINALVTGKLVDLSEQEMLDCEPSGDCNFGYVSKVFDWILLNKGVASEKDYAYTGAKGVCKASQVLYNFHYSSLKTNKS